MREQRLLLLFFISVLLSSCNHNYYIPNSQNVPIFKDKNEARLSVSSGGAVNMNTAEVQAAYSLPFNIAVMGSFMYTEGGNEQELDYGYGRYFEGAIGYYKPVTKNGVVEFYAGYGSSSQYHHYAGDGDYHGKASLFFDKVFIQPSFGLYFKYFDLALSARFSGLYFNKINNGIFDDSYDYDDVDLISRNKTSYLFEPAITIRGGWKYVKIQFQYVVSKNLTNSELKFERTNTSFGIYFSIDKRYRQVGDSF